MPSLETERAQPGNEIPYAAYVSSFTSNSPDDRLTDAMIVANCAVAYGGPVGEARYAHRSFVHTLIWKGGWFDHLATKESLEAACESIRDSLDFEARDVSRRICSKYWSLICHVADVVEKTAVLDGEEFLAIVDSHDLPMDGDRGEQVWLGYGWRFPFVPRAEAKFEEAKILLESHTPLFGETPG